MNGDFSRWPFEPECDYRGVRLQQGRPLGDWDWNELVEETFRLAQATSLDTFGGAAVVPLNTQDAFKLTWSGPTLMIGRGRMYVDGLLVENHGTGADSWDAALAESAGADPTPYEQQPYLLDPPPLPEGGPHLVYLDVWKREVNQFQAPALVEKALGVDTTTRIQTVWQLKVLDLSNAESRELDCTLNIDAWETLIAPSAGRLSTLTAKYASDDPCILPPAGGYTGLENQLYRIEIHQGGVPGKANFKWSRENASIEARVLSFVNATSFIVDSLGKDDFKSFKPGDWIELTDNRRELANEPGTMLKIADGGVFHDTRKIVVEAPPAPVALPAGTPDAALCTRIRRWDQAGKILRADTTPPTTLGDVDTSQGVIAVPSDNKTAIALENGIAVSFDVAKAGGEFKAGDYWLFAARSVDASIEVLDHAPPRGIHHHYARIGIVDDGTTRSDCRQFWPPANAQQPPPPAVIDHCACTECVSPRDVAKLQDVILAMRKKGNGGTICLEAGDYELERTIVIPAGKPITLRGQGDATRLIASSPFAFVVIGAQNVSFERLAMRAIVRPARDDNATSGASILLYDSQHIRIDDLSFDAQSVEERGSVPTSFAALACATSRLGVPDGEIAAASTIDDIRMSNCRARTPTGIVCLAFVEPAADVKEALKQLQAERVVLREGPVNLDAFDIDDNQFNCAAQAISLQSTAPVDAHPLVHVRRNRIVGSADVAVSIMGTRTSEVFASTNSAYAEIAGNTIDQCGLAVNVAGYEGGSFDIVGNTFTQCGKNAGVQCLRAQWVQAVTIADNYLDFIGQGPKTGAMAAVLIDSCLTVQISRNKMFNIGPQKLPDIDGTKVTAIAIIRALGAVDVSGNLITQGVTAASAEGNAPAWCGIHIKGIGRQADGPATDATSPCAANVHSNQIGARLNAIAALVENIDTCHYCNNQSTILRRFEVDSERYADVVVTATSLIVNNNTIKGSSRLSALLTNKPVDENPGAVIGNVSTGRIVLNGKTISALNYKTSL